MNETRAKKAAPLLEQAKRLKKENVQDWAWLLANVRHAEFDRRLSQLHAKEQRLHVLQRRISNIASGKPEYGEAIQERQTPYQIREQ